ncbi:DUF4190 domain-containing protein [Brevibacterium luteolum]|uniref:DUF4190 domain-containing protein n=1 Tax=Brevibacterium luteolum TaxID=199591 RepID=UPI001C22B790|nr:DUF4190 domain-containing protein [Brevibacterium luteolum]MBU8579686.1 hypothetical protein [Brevibacterium luteolum]
MSTPNNPNDKASFWTGTPGHDQGHPRMEPAPTADESGSHRPAGRKLSITAIWMSVVSLLFAIPWPVFSAVPSLIGLPFAIIGLKRADRKGGLAITALVLSIITLALGIFLTVLFFRMTTGVGF